MRTVRARTYCRRCPGEVVDWSVLYDARSCDPCGVQRTGRFHVSASSPSRYMLLAECPAHSVTHPLKRALDNVDDFWGLFDEYFGTPAGSGDEDASFLDVIDGEL